MTLLLVLRPEPGASATTAAAEALGLRAVKAPLFTVGPVRWSPPAAEDYDALMLTSANAARLAGPALAGYRGLPLFAVGAATARAAEAAGLRVSHAGAADAAALLATMAAEGMTRVLHLAGAEHRPVTHPALAIDRRIVYRAAATPVLPDAARQALATGAVALLHSPRAAALFRTLATATALPPDALRLAAISPAVAAAAGGGWRAVAVATQPRDDALLAAARVLCQ